MKNPAIIPPKCAKQATSPPETPLLKSDAKSIASGALFGLLLAYGIIFSERETYFMGLFPMKAKYFVMIAGAIDFASLLSSGVSGGEVAYLAHLGGIIAGFFILKTQVYLKVQQTKNKLKKKNGSLRLVVDNDKVKDQSNPKYWN